MSFQLPSLYWPLAKLGICHDRRLRKVFRFVICDLYRKRVWNPAINSWVKYRGFDQQRHLSLGNLHAACSAILLLVIPLYLIAAHQAAMQSLPQVERLCYLMVAAAIVLEVVSNVPAIILCRYLYLITLRKPDLTRRADASKVKSA
jgi:hypothetical protein